MSAATRRNEGTMSKDESQFQKWMARGEAELARAAARLLASERFVTVLQGAVQQTLSAKGFMDRNLRLALTALNLPSTADIRALNDRLDELERSIADLDGRLSELSEGRSKPARRSKEA
jgi:polyhydroxyalkanoate synthesis regulator phasin